MTITAGELPLLLLSTTQNINNATIYSPNINQTLLRHCQSLTERLHNYFIGRRLKKIIISYYGY
ncbi:hypothetical protein A678_01723 [Salmonella enterica subsp. enterica serovar Enteritidis str. 2010K-0271]|nr:hypothetical protein A678_01723 [Salmonella enterica subsp. enterica serovar Enteritidis str. 2010K-0271]